MAVILGASPAPACDPAEHARLERIVAALQAAYDEPGHITRAEVRDALRA